MDQAEPRPFGLPAWPHPQQRELPFAIVYGEPLTEPPQDLYIPPDALRVFLEAFEGPLDLLLYLIRRQNLDVLDINVVEIIDQYIRYIDLLGAMHIELAAEYLVMAATLAEIKSKMLLPKPAEEEEDDTDLRADLLRRLQEYEQIKGAAEKIDLLPRMERNFYQTSASPPPLPRTRPEPPVELHQLLQAMSAVMHREEIMQTHHVSGDVLPMRDRMTHILAAIDADQLVPFVRLFAGNEGRLGIVVTFIALMELVRERLAEVMQAQSFAPIHVRATMETEHA